ncbi:MAG: hypothetical protein HYZ26_00510 [Chloroflexi bacterium]|nr:hypothetical protein [Chloroflexota bacterium]
MNDAKSHLSPSGFWGVGCLLWLGMFFVCLVGTAFVQALLEVFFSTGLQIDEIVFSFLSSFLIGFGIVAILALRKARIFGRKVDFRYYSATTSHRTSFLVLGGLVLSLACCGTFFWITTDSSTAIPEGNVSQETPTLDPNWTLNQPSSDTAAPIFTETPSESPSSTVIPSQAVSPTITPIVLQSFTPTPTAPPIIVDASQILSHSVEEVERILGNPLDVFPIGPGESWADTEGGEAREYRYGKYAFYIDYDMHGIAKLILLFDGLADYKYVLSDWQTILLRFGLSVTQYPDVTAPARYGWTSYQGLTINITMNGTIPGSTVFGVQIYYTP